MQISGDSLSLFRRESVKFYFHQELVTIIFPVTSALNKGDMDEKENLIQYAYELSCLIKDTDIYSDYIECKDILNKDHQASELVNKLVTLGKEISENMSMGENSSQETLLELERLKVDFDNNNTAQKYIKSQKKYLGLLDEVIKRIVNPERE